ncbi:hypothetical protein FRC12_011518, partial [Ceratobasidium sp. 428]
MSSGNIAETNPEESQERPTQLGRPMTDNIGQDSDAIASLISELQGLGHEDRDSGNSGSNAAATDQRTTPLPSGGPSSPVPEPPATPVQPSEDGTTQLEAPASHTITIQVRGPSGTGPADPAQEAAMLEEIGNMHTNQYQQRGQLQDINIAIACHSRAASMTPDEDPMKFVRLGSVGSGHLLRFSQLGRLADLETAIAYHSQAVTMIPDGHPQKFGMLANLGGSHLSRFERLGNVEDLEIAIQCQSRALWLVPEDHPFKLSLMNNLGQSLYSRYERLGDIADLDKAIENQSRSVSLTPDGQQNKAGRLNNLGRSYLARFKHQGEAQDLNMSIECQTLSVSLTADDHPEKAGRLQDLAISYHTRFEREGNSSDLQEAIEGHTTAVNLTSDENPDKSLFLSSLATSYSTGYKTFGRLQDLEAAISCLSTALSRSPDDHPGTPAILNNLANALSSRYNRLGVLADLDEAINNQVQAVNHTPDDHPGKPQRLTNLGTLYHDRFQRLGDFTDLEEDITCQLRALAISPRQHTLRYVPCVNAGAALFTRFRHTKNLSDINGAIENFKEALTVVPLGHTDEHILLNNLGTAQYSRFCHLRELVDLEEAIDLQTRAALLLSDEHPDKPRWLNNLGVSCLSLFENSNNMTDLDNAIKYQTQASLLLPHDHPLQSMLQCNLGKSYRSRIQLGESADLDQCLDCFRRAAEAFTGPPSERLTAAREWARLSFEKRPAVARDAYTQVMELIQRVVWLGSTVEHQFNRIETIGDIALEASTAAIIYEDYNTALEWLDEGRSIVWKQLLGLRAPLDELFNVDKSLAQELKQVNQDLESISNISTVPHSTSIETTSLERTAQKQRRLAERWEELVRQVRLLPGMSGFLLPKRTTEMVAAARTGAVVSIVVHPHQSNALVIAQNSTKVDRIVLPRLSLDKANRAHQQFARSLRSQGRGDRGITNMLSSEDAFDKTLLMLWADIVKPVLEFLGHTDTPLPEELPRIIWCTTGALNILPLHAAGNYNEPGCTLCERAVSSYTPYLSALLVSPPDPTSFSGLLAVGQAITTGFSPLPGTIAELDRVQHQAQNLHFTRLDGANATSSAVLSAIAQHSW